MAQTLHLKTPAGKGYDIIIEPGARHRMAEILAQHELIDRRIIVGTNATISPLYGREMAESLPNAVTLTIQDGEQHKTLQTVEAIYSGLVKLGMDRSSLMLALGGGVIGDTMGFVAATFMRGIRLVQMPTSLLAMVDASVGGKTGVDLPEGKNLVGSFKQPELVIIDTEMLETLPDVEWRCGLAEVVKHGLLADPVLLDAGLLTRDLAHEFVPRAVRVKIDVVKKDPFENNIRAYLNLGHTFAHALELVSGYTWKHGDAVAVGLVAAAKLSANLALCDPDLPGHVESLLQTLGLPTSIGKYDPEGLWQAMATDKKWQQGKVRFVLLKGIAKPHIMEDVPRDAVIQALRELSD